MMEFRNPFSFNQPFHHDATGAGCERIKSYHGMRRVDGSCAVWVEVGVKLPDVSASVLFVERGPLPLRLETRGHSPTGLAWGYGGSGPAQLALALLTDALGDLEKAVQHYQDFKGAVVANWGEHWSISQQDIRAFIGGKD